MSRVKFRPTKKGQKISLELSVKEYEKLLDDLEELDAIRAYDAAKGSGETAIPFDQAVRQIDRSRK